MPSWDELFKKGASFEGVESEVARAAQMVEKLIPVGDIAAWDVGCGNGRHTAFFASQGYRVFASDNSPTALEKTKDLLDSGGFEVTYAEADMEELPFGETNFNLIVAWNVIQHASMEKIRHVIGNFIDRLAPGGMLVLCVKSDKAEEAGTGDEIEPGTYVMAEGPETGVPHHYFNRAEIDVLFSPLDVVHLAEAQSDMYASFTSQSIPKKSLPYHNAHWIIVGQKPAADGNLGTTEDHKSLEGPSLVERI